MRVFIAPVGEQPTPNLIPLFALPPDQRPELVQFMVSGNRRIQQVVRHLRDAIEKEPALAGVKVADPDLSMDAWNLEKARQQCERAIARYQDNGHSVVIGLTGGTKIMSLAAYQAGVQSRAPMLYVNTEQREIIEFDGEGRPLASPTPLQVQIPIETQFRAAGREFRKGTTPVRPETIPPQKAEFARHILDNYDAAHEQLIRKVMEQRVKIGPTIPFVPQEKSIATAQKAHDLGFWVWDKAAGTIRITDADADKFLRGGWVEVFVLVELEAKKRNKRSFDEVLGNVEIDGFAGELDVVVTRNARPAIIECKITGPQGSDDMASTIAKVRLHEVIFGGPYALSVFVRPSNKNASEWAAMCRQYGLSKPIEGIALKNLESMLLERFEPSDR